MKFLEIEWKGKIYKLWAQRDKNSLWIHYRGCVWLWNPEQIFKEGLKKKKKILKGLILSSMPGRIDSVSVKKGDKVEKGKTLLVMSAMKIEYNFRAEAKGVVEDVYCKSGQTVNFNQKLVKINYVPN